MFNYIVSFYVVNKLDITTDQVIPEEVVQALYSTCKSGNFELAEKEVSNVIAEGYPVSQIISQVLLVVVNVVQ